MKTYYIYGYKDPSTNELIYVGKGTGNRYKEHLYACRGNRKKQLTRFYNKLEKILKTGRNPEIVFLREDIDDEDLAYDIEASIIKHLGRKGYEENGILLNTCIDARPPSNKGKTFKQIYGDRADEEIEKRRPTEAYRRWRSKNVRGTNHPRFGVEVLESTKQKISQKKQINRHGTPVNYFLTSPDNKIEIFSDTVSLKQKINQLGLSISTLFNQMYQQRPISKYGKSAGWKLEMRPINV